MSKVNRRTFLKAAGIGGAAVAAAPTVIVKPARADTIRVGGLHDRTGVIGIYGNEMADALVFAVDEINAAGGVLGQQLELIEYDAQSTMANYSQYAQRLATSDRVGRRLRRHHQRVARVDPPGLRPLPQALLLQHLLRGRRLRPDGLLQR